MSEIITPIIHMNGDRKDTLIANVEAASLAVKAAARALCQRYSVPGQFEHYEAQYWERRAHLTTAMELLVAEVNQIEDENPGRK